MRIENLETSVIDKMHKHKCWHVIYMIIKIESALRTVSPSDIIKGRSFRIITN